MTNVIDVCVGAQLRACRERKGLSKAQLALALGISETELESLETGAARLHPHLMARACNHLGIAVGELFRTLKGDRQAAVRHP